MQSAEWLFTNAETIEDARVAREFGAEGIGLCRTEHMFFDADRIVSMREMIIADSKEGRSPSDSMASDFWKMHFLLLFFKFFSIAFSILSIVLDRLCEYLQIIPNLHEKVLLGKLPLL